MTGREGPTNEPVEDEPKNDSRPRGDEGGDLDFVSLVMTTKLTESRCRRQVG